jgi:hypothetical protein
MGRPLLLSTAGASRARKALRALTHERTHYGRGAHRQHDRLSHFRIGGLHPDLLWRRGAFVIFVIAGGAFWQRA